MEQAAANPPAHYNLRYVWLISLVAAFAEAEVRDIQSTLSKQEVQRVRFQDLLEPKMTKILLVGVTLACYGFSLAPITWVLRFYFPAGAGDQGQDVGADRARARELSGPGAGGGRLPWAVVSARLE